MIDTLFERIGGAPAVGAAVNNLYERLMGDPQIKHHFDDHDMRTLKKHQRAFLTVALGGQEAYYGRGMKSAHANLNITNQDFDRVAGHLKDVLLDLGLGAKDVADVIAVVGSLRADIVGGQLTRA